MFQVFRDGKSISPVLDSENSAWVWLQKHQGMSVDWALRYEGYTILEVGSDD